MDVDDKKPSTLQKVVENLTHPTTVSTSPNIREVDFKRGPDDIVQTLGADTDAILITFERDKGELKLYHNGIEIDKAVFAKTFRAKTGFYSLFDYIQDRFKSWRDAWVS